MCWEVLSKKGLESDGNDYCAMSALQLRPALNVREKAMLLFCIWCVCVCAKNKIWLHIKHLLRSHDGVVCFVST